MKGLPEIMGEKISRRQFLKILAAAVAGSSVLLYKLFDDNVLKSMAQNLSKKTFLPIVIAETPAPSQEPTETATDPVPEPSSTPNPPPTGSRVVHVHDTDATSWDESQIDYWNYINKNVVNNMVDLGIISLTGISALSDAWHNILPSYSPGEGIAIKVNFNNSNECNNTDGRIDSTAELINAVIRGLKLINVEENDIWIYDAIRAIPERFTSKIEYEGVRFFDKYCHETAGFESNDSNAFVEFEHHDISNNLIRISDILIDATYLINIPLMKRHGIADVSLSFKHHFGSINLPRELHDYIRVFNSETYSPLHNPMVDILKNHHIKDKTILIIGDGLFSSRSADDPPQLWSSLNNQTPNSMFFAFDPVAIDSVMCDVLESEKKLHTSTRDYLVLASQAGLGVYERGIPWELANYNQIDYLYIDK